MKAVVESTKYIVNREGGLSIGNKCDINIVKGCGDTTNQLTYTNAILTDIYENHQLTFRLDWLKGIPFTIHSDIMRNGFDAKFFDTQTRKWLPMFIKAQEPLIEWNPGIKVGGCYLIREIDVDHDIIIDRNGIVEEIDPYRIQVRATGSITSEDPTGMRPREISYWLERSSDVEFYEYKICDHEMRTDVS